MAKVCGDTTDAAALLYLFDKDEAMVEAWKKEFADRRNVKIEKNYFHKVECEQIVTAGNSYGWMTGGIDLAARDYYGVEIQDVIQNVIINYHGGCLPVGECFRVATGDKYKPNLIYAPTIKMPGFTADMLSVYKVFLTILIRFYNPETELACCGLGTATGELSVEDAAKAMRMAYDNYFLLDGKEVPMEANEMEWQDGKKENDIVELAINGEILEG